MSFHHKLKPIQYNACFAITVTIRGTSKLVQKTRNVLQNLQKQKCPKYLLKLIPVKTHAYITENVDNIHCFKINATSSKTLSFLLHWLNGTIYILPFGTQKVLLVSKIISWNFLDFLGVMFLIAVTIKV